MSASFFRQKGRATLAVADRGMGILRHLRLRHRADITDEKLLAMALEPGISGAFDLGDASGPVLYGNSNAGLGLFIMRMIAEHTQGTFTVVANGYAATSDASGAIQVDRASSAWTGTALCLSYWTSQSDRAMRSIEDAITRGIRPNRKKERLTFDPSHVQPDPVMVNLKPTYGSVIADKQEAIRLRDHVIPPFGKAGRY